VQYGCYFAGFTFRNYLYPQEMTGYYLYLRHPKGEKNVKKLGMVLGAFVVIILAAMIIIPLVVDVDKYRPQIVQLANENINGRLELGKLKLSLWGQIRIEVGGVTLKDAGGKQIMSVKDAYFHLPFTSVFSGSPVLTFKMIKPELSIIKERDGKLNAMKLIKEKPKTSSIVPSAPTAAEGDKAVAKDADKATSGGTMALPAIATRARMGIELRDAMLTYSDAAGGLSSKVNNLNVVVRDISLSRPTELEIWADIDTRQSGKSGAMSIVGPIKLNAKAQPTIDGGKIGGLVASLKVDLDNLEIMIPGLFEKKKGIAANAEGSISATEQDAKIDKFVVRFFNAEITTTGRITQLRPPAGAGKANPVVAIVVKSNDIALKPWVELIPMLKQYQLGGNARLDAAANGPADKLDYNANLALKGVTAKAPNLKVQPVIDMGVKIETDRIDNMFLTMRAPGNDLKMNARLVSFSKPSLIVEVHSTGMDLDQLMDFPPPAPKADKKNSGKAVAAGDAAGAAASAPKAAKNTEADFDAMLDPLRRNPMAAQASAVITANIKFIKAMNIRISDIVVRKTFRNLVVALEQFSMKVFRGSIKASMSADLKPKAPVYKIGAEVAGLDLKEAVTSQLALFKNTLLGKLFFKLDASGSSFNPTPAVNNLVAKGSFKVEKAAFATIDVGKMASEGIGKALARAGEKVPQLKGKSIKDPGGRESRYEFVGSDFSIAHARFTAPNFHAKSEPGQGIDLKGNTEVGINDFSLKAAWQVIDTHNLTKARDINVEQAGVRVEHVLAEGSEPVRFPVTAGCSLKAPCYSYTEVPEHFARIAGANIARAAGDKARAEVQKRAQEALKKAPAPVQNAVKKLKLFGR